MKNTLMLCFLGITSLLGTKALAETKPAQSSCFELPHADGYARNICNKNGKSYLIMEFFLPNCGACHRNVGQFKKLEAETQNFAHSRLISLRGLQDTLPFIRSHGISTEVALDSLSQAKRIYGIGGVPAIVVIDQYNQVVYRTSGYLSDSEIDTIRNLVSGYGSSLII